MGQPPSVSRGGSRVARVADVGFFVAPDIADKASGATGLARGWLKVAGRRGGICPQRIWRRRTRLPARSARSVRGPSHRHRRAGSGRSRSPSASIGPAATRCIASQHCSVAGHQRRRLCVGQMHQPTETTPPNTTNVGTLRDAVSCQSSQDKRRNRYPEAAAIKEGRANSDSLVPKYSTARALQPYDQRRSETSC
jgi:hypothetical protein